MLNIIIRLIYPVNDIPPLSFNTIHSLVITEEAALLQYVHCILLLVIEVLKEMSKLKWDFPIYTNKNFVSGILYSIETVTLPTSGLQNIKANWRDPTLPAGAANPYSHHQGRCFTNTKLETTGNQDFNFFQFVKSALKPFMIISHFPITPLRWRLQFLDHRQPTRRLYFTVRV